MGHPGFVSFYNDRCLPVILGNGMEGGQFLHGFGNAKPPISRECFIIGQRRISAAIPDFAILIPGKTPARRQCFGDGGVTVNGEGFPLLIGVGDGSCEDEQRNRKAENGCEDEW